MKEGIRRYRIFIERVGDVLEKALPSREIAAQMASAFAAHLEQIVRRYPTQWYNFFDFWK